MYLYFAHLETQAVSPHDKVSEGQIIGTVGNSGNARSTPPHLHFGIYRNGPIDPIHFITETNLVPESIRGDTLLLGKLVRSNQSSVIQSSPNAPGSPVDTIEKHSLIKVRALSGSMYRVMLPEGLSGYISENHVEEISDSIALIQNFL